MIGILVRLMESVNPSQAEMMRAQIAAGQSVVGAIVNGLIVAVLLVIFSTLGGLIGIPIFEKRKRDLMPPPPQNFG